LRIWSNLKPFKIRKCRQTRKNGKVKPFLWIGKKPVQLVLSLRTITYTHHQQRSSQFSCFWFYAIYFFTLVQSHCEWVSNAKSAIFKLHVHHGENKLIFNEMMMISAWYYTNILSWIFIVLAHWNNSPRIDMSLHSDTLSWFRSNQSLLFLLNAACLAERKQITSL
jgi:hypothetical protein